MAYMWPSHGKTVASALRTLREGIPANPGSFVLGLAYAASFEEHEGHDSVRNAYDALFETLKYITHGLSLPITCKARTTR